MKSMTGYGKGTALLEDRKVTIELKSVNNRYLEINSRVPKNMMICDEIIRSCIQNRIKRGTVDVFFNYENNSQNSISIDFNEELAKKLIDIAEDMNRSFNVSNDFNCAALMRSPDVICFSKLQDDEEIFSKLSKVCINEAVDSLEKMRQSEGASIKRDLHLLLGEIDSYREFIAKRAPEIVEEYRLKVTQRVREILKSVAIDESKLLNEVAFFADKSDINEELSRLGSHISQFKQCLEDCEAVGRKLDFISQEINREVNTIASKSNDLGIINTVIEMKNCLEKIREQIRNIE